MILPATSYQTDMGAVFAGCANEWRITGTWGLCTRPFAGLYDSTAEDFMRKNRTSLATTTFRGAASL